MRNQRNKNIQKIPKERRKIRPNVEATMKEFKVKTKAGKIKVRGMFKASIFAFAMGISINFGRIYRYLNENGLNFDIILTNFNKVIFKIIFLIFLVQNRFNKTEFIRNFSTIKF